GAQVRALKLAEADDFDALAGKGAVATVEGRRIVIGNARMMDDAGIDVAALKADAEELRREGATALFVGVDASAVGVIAIADPVKPTTPDAVAALRKAGVRIVMLTGDNRTTAEAVARRLGISEVEAEILPDDKAHVVERLREAGRVVAMAGDGVNDGRGPAAGARGVGT